MKKAVKGVKIDGELVKFGEDFHFHDLKAMGVTDHADNISGHMSEKMKRVYIRRPMKVEATR